MPWPDRGGRRRGPAGPARSRCGDSATRGVHSGGHILAETVRIRHVGIEHLGVDPDADARLARMGAYQAAFALAEIVFVEHRVIVVLRHSVSFRCGWLL